MNQKTKDQTDKYLRQQITARRENLAQLEADLDILHTATPEIPTWNALVSSAWSSEGEEDWNGTFEAPDLKQAIYHAMMEFCKKTGRTYPGYKSTSTNIVYESFDVQGTIYIQMVLPNGSTIPSDRKTVDTITKQFNKKAPRPPKPKRRQPDGITV